MPNKAIPSLITSDAFVIQPSDTVKIKDDSNNLSDYNYCYVYNPTTAGTVKVLPAGGTVAVTMYAVQGQVLGGNTPILVQQVFNTTPTPPTGLIGLVPRGN